MRVEFLCEYAACFDQPADLATAEALASFLVEGRFAACVNILQPCRSVYRWQGEVEAAQGRCRCSSRRRKPAIRRWRRRFVRGIPYETPEIIALPVVRAGRIIWPGWQMAFEGIIRRFHDSAFFALPIAVVVFLRQCPGIPVSVGGFPPCGTCTGWADGRSALRDRQRVLPVS